MERAECRGEDTALFFPELGGNAAKARVICSRCPVRRECLDYAVADGELAGMWGGTTALERRNFGRSRRPGRTIMGEG